MCGIFCSVARHGYVVPSKITKERLIARGPDASKEVQVKVKATSEEDPVYVTLFSTVLSLRGCATTEQPLQRSGSDTALCWNGEAWKIRNQRPHENDNDTSAVYDLLSLALNRAESPAGTSSQDSAIASASIISSTLSLISGPYAFVYYHKETSRLFFGRDFLGRRSLLWKVGENQELLLSSVGDGSLDGSWTEVEADGIYCIDFASKAATMPSAERCSISSDFNVFKVPYTFSHLSDNNTSVGRSFHAMEYSSYSCKGRSFLSYLSRGNNPRRTGLTKRPRLCPRLAVFCETRCHQEC